MPRITLLEATKIAILVICVIVAFLGLVTSIIGFVLWIIEGFRVELLIGSLFVFFFITLPLSYVVTKYKGTWEDFERRMGYVPKTPKEQMRTFVSYAITVFVFFYLLSFLNQYIGPFPEKIGIALGIEILKVVVEIDGILIGLSGVVYAQLFRSEMPKNRIIEGLFITTLLFIISVFYSISGMASTHGYLEKNSIELLWRPLYFMLFGLVTFLVFILRGVRVKEEKKEPTT